MWETGKPKKVGTLSNRKPGKPKWGNLFSNILSYRYNAGRRKFFARCLSLQGVVEKFYDGFSTTLEVTATQPITAY